MTSLNKLQRGSFCLHWKRRFEALRMITWKIKIPRAINQFDVIMSAMAPRFTGVLIVYSAVCSGTDQRKHPSSASLAFARGTDQWLVNFPHKGPVTRKMFLLMTSSRILVMLGYPVIRQMLSIEHNEPTFNRTQDTRLQAVVYRSPLQWRHNGCDDVSNH